MKKTDKKVDCKHIEYLIKDEKEANEEYSEDAKGDPKIDKVALTDEEKAKLGEMANDELRHNGFWKDVYQSHCVKPKN